MKKILFTIYNLNIGGVQKTLINIINNLKLSDYEIEIITYEKNIILANTLPKSVKVSFLEDYVDLKSSSGIIQRIDKNICIKKYLRKYNNIISKEYDVAIAFDGFDNDIDLLVPCIKAKKKIIWVHNDFYNIIENSRPKFLYKLMYKKMGRKFQYFDNIIIVCDEVANGFNKLYNNKYNSKIKVINNYIDELQIRKLSNEKYSNILSKHFNIISVGRICKAKNYEKLLNIHKKLIANNYKVSTYIIGTGNTENKLKEMIKKNNLETSFYLLGRNSNPYPIMKNADLFISTSRYESFANCIVESLILGVPVISTTTSGAKNIEKNIADKKSVMLCSTEEEIYNNIINFINHKDKIKSLELKEYNQNIINEIKNLLE